MNYRLRLTEYQHAKLRAHLFPGDGFEAVAVALCARQQADGDIALLIQEVVPVPHDRCTRDGNFVRWSPLMLEPYLKRASDASLSILKVHSHPSGWREFSKLDDESDRRVFESIHGWAEGPHASAIMLPDGELVARMVLAGGKWR